MNQQAPAAPPQNPYDFIHQQNQQPKKGILPNPSSQNGRIAMVVGGIVLLLIGFFVVLAVINGLQSGDKNVWLKLAQKQEEVVRISKLGTDGAQSLDTKNLAQSAYLTALSSQTDINSLAQTAGVSTDKKVLSATKDAAIDTQLEQATQSNQFDETFEAILKEELLEYQVALQAAFEQATTDATKEILRIAHDNAEALAAQATD